MPNSRRARGRPADRLPSILIVDDSVVARAVMARALTAEGRFEVVASVPDVAAARTVLATKRVDVVLLDIEMPGIDGLSALPDLLLAAPATRVIVVSSACESGGAATVQALALGAADTLEKPQPGQGSASFGAALADKIERLMRPGEVARSPLRAVAPNPRFDVVAIGASTGGIHALSKLLRALPAEFTTPILVTQHLPASFMPYFAAQVAVLAGRPCDIAEDRMRLRPSRVVIAPGEAHMRCVRTSDGVAVRLSTAPATSGCLPSVDPMLASVAEVFGNRALAVVLSGMGRDGADGAQAVIAAGGTLMAQDSETSVVWGMPGAAAAAGAQVVAPPDELGRLIAAQVAVR